MIKHLFKLIWNRRHSNFLMAIEIFFSFLILFAVSSVLFSYAMRYQKPLGFEHEHVWRLQFYSETEYSAEEKVRLEQLARRLKELPQVKEVALAGGPGPYSGYTSSQTLDDIEISANIMTVYQPEYLQVMGLQLEEGRWFSEGDGAWSGTWNNRLQPIVITRGLSRSLFGDKEAVGQTVNKDYLRPFLVIGVVKAYRSNGEFSEEKGAFFIKKELTDSLYGLPNSLYLQMQPGTDAAYEEKITETAAAVLGPAYITKLVQLKALRAKYFRDSLVPISMFILIGVFLVLNVALGIFGILWHNINKRYSEIGLRRALGATAGSIYRQFLGEVLVLTTISLGFGCFFALQFLLLNFLDLAAEVYYTALASSVLLIYVLVICCALFPSRQAAAIQPATALHEE